MSFGRVRLFGSEVKRIIGRMHEFTLYKPIENVLENYFYSLSQVWMGTANDNIYYGLYGFIQPRFTMDERFEIKGISELGGFVGHFESRYKTTRGEVEIEVEDRIYWEGNYLNVSVITKHHDAKGGSIIRAGMERVVGEEE